MLSEFSNRTLFLRNNIDFTVVTNLLRTNKARLLLINLLKSYLNLLFVSTFSYNFTISTSSTDIVHNFIDIKKI